MAKKQTTSQFMHLELYSRAGNITTKKTSSGGVIKEATRVDGFTDHIIADGFTPAAPTYLFSQDDKTLDQHYDEILAQVETEKDGIGRRIKTDKNILLAGVLSYPKPRLADNWTADDKQNYETFKEQTLDFLREEWGDNLLCVIEHTDEQYPHLHFYIANKQRIASTPEMHPGELARIKLEKQAKAEGVEVVKKEQAAAYRTAMRQFQDRFYNKVSVFCGLDRLGPKVQRLNREEWKQRKYAVKKLSQAFNKVKNNLIESNKDMEELERQIANVIGMQETLNAEHKAIADNLGDIDLAKFVRENYKDIVLKYQIDKRNKAEAKQDKPGTKWKL